MPVSRLFLIDAHALCYRSFYAIRELRNTKGQPTNAVYGFVAALKKLLREYEPHYLAVCFDMKGKVLRQEKYADYKIQRPSMPDDLKSQIPIIKDVVAAFRLPVIEKEGYEADDVIATIARKITAKDLEIVIVSDDKDMFQLVGEHVKILNSRQEGILGLKEAEELLGFPPAVIPDYLALAGDQVDNIPGVKGIGEVSAKSLLKEYGSLKEILKHVTDIKPDRAKSAISSQIEMAKLSYELALLEENVPIELDLESMRVGNPDQKRLADLFTELEFRKFAAEFQESSELVAVEKTEVSKITSAEEWNSFVKIITKDKHFSFYYTGGQYAEAEIAPPRKILLSGKDRKVCEIDLEKKEWLTSLFLDEDIVKITYDVKSQLKALPQDFKIKGVVFDVLLAGYLLSQSTTNFELAGLAWEYLKKTIPGPEIDPALCTQLSGELYPVLTKQLHERDQEKLFSDLEVPLAFVLADMEREGVCIDQKLLNQLNTETTKRIDALTKDLYRLAGEEFNLNSPKQLSHVLFEKLKLPVVKKTKTGFSTDESVLLKLAEQHELPEKLLEYRQLAKLKSTYIEALPKLADDAGRVHTTFNQAGAETGRLSSINPNLQNIPIRSDLGRQIRGAFIASGDDHEIISADYSQIELRILAHLSGDANLKKAFARGDDIHNYTAAQIFDVKESEVDAEMRNSAKRVNFGIIYGMSAFGLSKDLKISQVQAQDFIDRYFARYPDVKKFMDLEIAKCKKQGYVTTILHRRRYIPEINSANIGLRQFAERQAINTPVQGSAADMIKLAMVQIAEELKKKNFSSKMIITVHDELVFDALISEEKKLVALVRERMENTLALSVPIVVSMKKGKNWLKTEKI